MTDQPTPRAPESDMIRDRWGNTVERKHNPTPPATPEPTSPNDDLREQIAAALHRRCRPGTPQCEHHAWDADDALTVVEPALAERDAELERLRQEAHWLFEAGKQVAAERDEARRVIVERDEHIDHVTRQRNRYEVAMHRWRAHAFKARSQRDQGDRVIAAVEALCDKFERMGWGSTSDYDKGGQRCAERIRAALASGDGTGERDFEPETMIEHEDRVNPERMAAARAALGRENEYCMCGALVKDHGSSDNHSPVTEDEYRGRD